jgi:hypothetical protein
MAFGKKYFTSYKSYNGWDYYLEIWVDGYSSSSTEITLGEGGPVISYDTDKENRFSPINSSKLELPFMVTNVDTDNFIKDIKNTFNERDVYVHLYKGTSSDYTSSAPLWSGFVLMDLSATPDKYYPYPVKLTAVDGLALLKEKDWVKYTSYDTPANTPGNYDTNDRYYGPAKFTFWLKEILFKTGMSTTGSIACGGITPPNTGVTEDYQIVTAVNWYNAAMPDTNVASDPLDFTKCSMSMMYNVDANENITPVNTYNVLENILRHWGARITYWKHKFYIVQIPEYITDETGTATNPDNINSRTYNLNAAVQSSQDNLGSTYWTRYQLPVNGTLDGGIRKLSGGTFDYMPKLKQVTARFIDYGNRNYYGGFPFGVDPSQTPYAPSSLVFQDEIADISNSESLKINIPLDIELNTNDFQWAGNTQMKIYFNLYFTNGSTTYYLIFDKYNTPQYYWSTQKPEQIGPTFNKVRPFWQSFIQHTSAVQTLVGFDKDLEFKDSVGDNLNLTGSWKFYIDIEPWGANGETMQGSTAGSHSSSFRLFNAFSFGLQYLAAISPFTSGGINYISWTNSLQSNSQPLNPTDIGSTNPGVITTINGNITYDYTPGFVQNPFQGQLLFISNVVGATYGTELFEIDPNGAEVESEDLGEMIWGDSLMSTSQGSLQVWNGSGFQKSSAAGQWGVGTISGTDSFTRLLLQQYLNGAKKVVQLLNLNLVISEENKEQNSRPMYVNPIGRLRHVSTVGSAGSIIYSYMKTGSWSLLKDEITYEGYQILYDGSSNTAISNQIIGGTLSQDNDSAAAAIAPPNTTQIPLISNLQIITPITNNIAAYGSDVITNGSFTTDANWTKGTGWSIASNKATFTTTGSTSDLSQNALSLNQKFTITADVTVEAGGLTMKAGSSGGTHLMSETGVYEFPLLCTGSTLIIFTASAAFSGSINSVKATGQNSITSIPIQSIGTAIFKTNDVFKITTDDFVSPEFTITSDQSANDTSLSVASTNLDEDILINSDIVIDSKDLIAQYQNKTKGTVGGFDITATSIDSGSVAISSYIDDDSFGTASATSLATSESIKAYVDTQVGSADTLQEVTDLGNTTTNSIMIGSSSAPSEKLHILGSNAALQVEESGGALIKLRAGGTGYFGTYNNTNLAFVTNSTERMRLTSGGNLLIGTTSGSEKLVVSGNVQAQDSGFLAGLNGDKDGFVFHDLYTAGGNYWGFKGFTSSSRLSIVTNGIEGLTVDENSKVGIGVTSPLAILHTKAGSSGVSSVDAGTSTLIESNTTNYLRFANPDANIGGLVWTSPSDNFGAFVRWGHDTGLLEIATANSSDSITFATGNASEKMRLNSTGLGIGTSSPAYALDVASSGVTTLRLTSSGTGAMAMRYENVGGFRGGVVVDNNGLYRIDATNIQLNPTNNVGIGTSPTEKLDVGGNVKIRGTNNLTIGSTSDGGDFSLSSGIRGYKFANNNGELLRITSDGNLLINTTTDSFGKLQVNGNIKTFDSDGPYINLYRDDNIIKSGNHLGSIVFGGGPEAYQDSPLDDSAIVLKAEAAADAASGNSPSKLTIQGINNGSAALSDWLVLNNGTATFSGQVTIPATPVALTDAASKGYVDAQVGTADTLQEVTNLGNTTTNAITIGSSSSPSYALDVYGDVQFRDTSEHVRLYLTSNNAYNSIIYFGDENNGTIGRIQYKNSDNSLGFYTNTSERMRLDSSGRLLIGTTTDIGGELQVFSGDAILTLKGNNASYINAGTQLISGHASTARGMGTFAYCEHSDVEWFWGNPYNGNDAFVINRNTGYTVPSSQSSPPGIGSSQGTVFTINSSGNVTTGALTLSSTVDQILILKSTDDGPVYQSYYRGSDRHAYLGFGGSSDNFNIVNEESSGAITFGTNGSEKMRLTTTGLGIGTSSPSEKLEVEDGYILASGSGTSHGFELQRTGLDTFQIRHLDGNFTINNLTDSRKDFVIDGSGHVGINETSPAKPLHVYDATVNEIIKIESGDGGAFAMFADNNTTGNNLIGATGNNLAFWANSSERMRIKSNGNVLISTTTDDGSSKLQVSGSAKISDTDGSVAISGGNINLTDSGGGTMITLDSATGDGVVRWEDNNVQKWDIGRDNTDQAFVIANEAGLNDNQVVHINHSTGEFTLKGDLTIGEDDTGYDVTFYGNTSGRNLMWDASQDRLEFTDNARISIGTDNDLNIYNDGANTYIATNNTSGNFIITQNVDNADLIFKCDDGSGGNTAYITLDGSQTTINLQKTVLIGTTTNTGAYKIDVAGKQRVQDTLELDDVLMLNAISTPSDPAAGKSVIYMDSSDGGIKCKINVGGTVVTRTIASFE